MHDGKRAPKKTMTALILLILAGVLIVSAFLLGFSKPVKAFDHLDLNSKQSRLLYYARHEIGKGELGADNAGPDVFKYTHGQKSPWCAAFVSYVMDYSGIHDFGYLLSARSYYNKARVMGRLKHHDPRPGDLIVFSRGQAHSWTGHIGIIENVGPDRITTIEGNVGLYPAYVKRCSYRLGAIPHLLGFIKL